MMTLLDRYVQQELGKNGKEKKNSSPKDFVDVVNFVAVLG